MTKSSTKGTTSTVINPYPSPSEKQKRSPTKSPESPSKTSNVQLKKNILQVTNVFHTNGTPFGWIFGHAYDIKEQLKALSNKNGEVIFIGDIEFKCFINLKVKWIPVSQVGNNLWVMRIDEVDTAGINDNIFPISAHKAYSNKIVRAIIAQKIKTLGEIEITPDLTLTESNTENLTDMFLGEMAVHDGNSARNILFEEFIAEADEDVEELI